MSKDKLTEINQHIERLKEKRQKEIARVRKEEQRERTARLIDQGALLEAIYGTLGEEKMTELVMELRYHSKKIGKFQNDELDKKIANKESLRGAQLKSVEKLQEVEKTLKNRLERSEN